MIPNPFKLLWNMFETTKDDKSEKIQVSFTINRHLWQLWSTHCLSNGLKPNPSIEKAIEETLRVKLEIKE